jgi:hypothetical protein
MRNCLPLLLACGLLAGQARGAKYEIVEVTSAAVVRGTVLWSGPVPQPVRFEVRADAAVCGRRGYRESAAADVNPATLAVRNAFVSLRGVREGASFDDATSWAVAAAGRGPDVGRAAPTPRTHRIASDRRQVSVDRITSGPDAVMRLTSCDLTPPALLVPERTRLALLNDDPIFAHLQVEGPEGFSAGISLPVQGARETLRLARAGIYRITSERHPWIRAVVQVAEHPYHDLTDEHGAFELAGVPPGKYEIIAWHDGMGATPIVEKAVTVGYAFAPPCDSVQRIALGPDEIVEMRLTLAVPAK